MSLDIDSVRSLLEVDYCIQTDSVISLTFLVISLSPSCVCVYVLMCVLYLHVWVRVRECVFACTTHSRKRTCMGILCL